MAPSYLTGDASISPGEPTLLTLRMQVVEVNGRPYPPERPLGNGWSDSTASSDSNPLPFDSQRAEPSPPPFDSQRTELSPPKVTPPNNEQQDSNGKPPSCSVCELGLFIALTATTHPAPS